jgi:hypothetical protein
MKKIKNNWIIIKILAYIYYRHIVNKLERQGSPFIITAIQLNLGFLQISNLSLSSYSQSDVSPHRLLYCLSIIIGSEDP